MTPPDPTIIKVGGSILRDSTEYRRVAHSLGPLVRSGPTWIVVSAGYGVTDALYRIAARDSEEEVRALLETHETFSEVGLAADLPAELVAARSEAREGRPDRLYAWGERASASILRSYLELQGVELPVVELELPGPPPGVASAIVPGFYVRRRNGRITCLPRGGGDISAILVAAAFGARSVRLWKKGGGLLLDGRIVPSIASAKLLELDSDPLRPVCKVAVRLAGQLGIDILLEGPFGASATTFVVAEQSSRGACRFRAGSEALAESRSSDWESVVNSSIASPS